jgi:hypothetical protein
MVFPLEHCDVDDYELAALPYYLRSMAIPRMFSHGIHIIEAQKTWIHPGGTHTRFYTSLGYRASICTSLESPLFHKTPEGILSARPELVASTDVKSEFELDERQMRVVESYLDKFHGLAQEMVLAINRRWLPERYRHAAKKEGTDWLNDIIENHGQ